MQREAGVPAQSTWTNSVGRRAPNILTLCRFAAVPFFVLLLVNPTPARNLWAVGVFVFAALTDWLDGYLARAYQAESILGKLLDPLADKVLVMAALVMLAGDPNGARVPPWMVVVLLSREMIVTGLRSLAALKGVVVQASDPAKHKTAWTMVAIVFLLVDRPAKVVGVPVDFHFSGICFLVIALVLSVYSGLLYAFSLRKMFVEEGG
jgi:CDP-diacylglycerol--glycerol-3-phosphate 3-phosphatidyltransferase